MEDHLPSEPVCFARLGLQYSFAIRSPLVPVLAEPILCSTPIGLSWCSSTAMCTHVPPKHAKDMSANY